MSVRVVLDENNIWIGKLSKTDGSPQCGGPLPIHCESDWNKTPNKKEFSPSASLWSSCDIGLLLPSDSDSDELYSRFSCIWTCQPSRLCEPFIRGKYICIYSFYWSLIGLFLWRSLINTSSGNLHFTGEEVEIQRDLLMSPRNLLTSRKGWIQERNSSTTLWFFPNSIYHRPKWSQ